jgi:hypothetical protein
MSDIKSRGGKLVFKGDKPKKRKRREHVEDGENEEENDPQGALWPPNLVEQTSWLTLLSFR